MKRTTLALITAAVLLAAACSDDTADFSSSTTQGRATTTSEDGTTLADTTTTTAAAEMTTTIPVPGGAAFDGEHSSLPAGGTDLPNDEPYDLTFFENYGVNPRIDTLDDALSTFAVDVDTG